MEKPYQNGWIISYVVSNNFNGSLLEKEELQALIDSNYGIRYTKDVKVVRAIRTGVKTIKKKKKTSLVSDYFPGSHYVKSDKISTKYKEYYITKKESWSSKEFYKLQLPDRFLKIKISPNIITHTRGKDRDLESERAFLYEKLYHSSDYDSFLANYGKSYPKDKARRKIRDDINKFKNGDIDDIYNDRTPLEYEY